MFARLGAMGMIVVLAVRLVVEHVVVGIVLHLDELALAAQYFADHVEAALLQHAVAFTDFPRRRQHPRTLRRRNGAQVG